MKDLNEIRNNIDEIDSQLVELFNRRMELAGEVAAYKAQNNLPITNTGREREILTRVAEQSNDGCELYTKLYPNLIINRSS